MSQELVGARMLRDQRFGGVVFTVGGAEVLMGQWEPDAALFYEQKESQMILYYSVILC